MLMEVQSPGLGEGTSRVGASRLARVPGRQGLRGGSWGPGPCLAALLASSPSTLGEGDERWL